LSIIITLRSKLYLQLSVSVYACSANNMNMLSLVGMQQPEKYIRRISTFRAKPFV
jgi:hypothetical protein